MVEEMVVMFDMFGLVSVLVDIVSVERDEGGMGEG